MFALPVAKITPTVVVAMLLGLEGTPQLDEALVNLSDDLERSDVKEELRRWRAKGMSPTMMAKLNSYIT
jgi:hypothetical protein